MAVVLHCLLIQSVRMTALNSSVLSGILGDCLSMNCIFFMCCYTGRGRGEVLIVYRMERGIDLKSKKGVELDMFLWIHREFFKPLMNFVDSAVRRLAR